MNLKECAKRNSHISNRLHRISISSNNDKHPVTENYTTLHFTILVDTYELSIF